MFLIVILTDIVEIIFVFRQMRVILMKFFLKEVLLLHNRFKMKNNISRDFNNQEK